MGNATSPRMDRVRPKDINLYDKDGVLWVVSNSGGISTFLAWEEVKTGGDWMKARQSLKR
jgi:hypothetical protein